MIINFLIGSPTSGKGAEKLIQDAKHKILANVPEKIIITENDCCVINQQNKPKTKKIQSPEQGICWYIS